MSYGRIDCSAEIHRRQLSLKFTPSGHAGETVQEKIAQDFCRLLGPIRRRKESGHKFPYQPAEDSTNLFLQAIFIRQRDRSFLGGNSIMNFTRSAVTQEECLVRQRWYGF